MEMVTLNLDSLNLAAARKILIELALTATHGSVQAAANRLGISARQLRYVCVNDGIDFKAYKAEADKQKRLQLP